MIGETITLRLTEIAARQGMESIADIRGEGAMIAFELVTDRETNSPDARLAAEIVAEAEKRGLILLVCGTRFNVVRILPPLTIPESLVSEGVDILEASIEAAISTVNSTK